jgi:hypothetical protein
MTVSQIEKRLVALEAEVASLKSGKQPRNRWWDKIAGVFADNPRFKNAMSHAGESEGPRATRQRSRTHLGTSAKGAG